MKLKRGIPLIDQHDQYGFWGGKFEEVLFLRP